MALIVCPVSSYCKNKPCSLSLPYMCEFSDSYNYICANFISCKSSYCSTCWYRHDINACYDCDPFDLLCCLYVPEDSKHG